MLCKALGLQQREMIAAVGGGGKTSILFTLAGELLRLKKSVVVTTTTKIYMPRGDRISVLLGDKEGLIKGIKTAPRQDILVLGKNILTDNKIEGLQKEVLDEIFEEGLADYILVEADGAKQKPVKVPDSYEPVIPGKTTLVIGVVGIDAMGKPLLVEYFHRADIACSQLGYPYGKVMDEEVFASVIKWDKGLFKGVPPGARKVLVINKVDGIEQRHKARRVFDKVMSRWGEGGTTPDKVVFTSMLNKDPVIEVLP